FQGAFGDFAASHHVELIKDRANGCSLDLFQRVTGDRREYVTRARLARRASCRHFAACVDDAAVTDRRQESGKRKIAAQDTSAQIAVRDRYGLARAESDFLKGPTIFAQRDFVLRAS